MRLKLIFLRVLYKLWIWLIYIVKRRTLPNRIVKDNIYVILCKITVYEGRNNKTKWNTKSIQVNKSSKKLLENK